MRKPISAACFTVQFGVFPLVARFNRQGMGCSVVTTLLASDSLRMPSTKATSAPREWACFMRARASSMPRGWIASVLGRLDGDVGGRGLIPSDDEGSGWEVGFSDTGSVDARCIFFTRCNRFPKKMTTSFRRNCHVRLHELSTSTLVFDMESCNPSLFISLHRPRSVNGSSKPCICIYYYPPTVGGANRKSRGHLSPRVQSSTHSAQNPSTSRAPSLAPQALKQSSPHRSCTNI